MFSDKTLIGLDIGTDSVKMVEIGHSGQAPELVTYGMAKHSLLLEGYWDSTKLRQLSTIIEDIMSFGNFAGVKTVISVQSKDVYVTTMDFEASWNKKLIQEEIDKQAAYFLPYPPDEMRLSWSIIENDPRIKAYTGKQRVIINALPEFVIENSKNLLEHVNLDGVALENQTLSQIRSTLNPDNGNTLLVDIGAKQTTFSIIVDGFLRASSHIPVGGAKTSLELSKSLGIDITIAENFKRDLNLVNLFSIPKELIDTYTVIKSELQTFYELNKKVAQDPQKVVVTGGGILIAGFLEFLKDFPVPVYLGNCLRNIKVNPDILPYILPQSSSLSTALGLGLKNDI
ncbi:MAG: pilus assembly protein PilM [Patescibacteria group bacterium]